LAPRNDVAQISHTTPRSRGVIRPRFARTVRASINRGRRESRVANAPAASRAKCNEHTSVVTTGSPETDRPSLRNGFTAYFALFPVTRLCCHRRLRVFSQT
jgi:hypothetical protein